ncbi:DUF1294 domain-containing protein [Deinococcus aquaedulcis]|uniref:DUF1294 domain-containing protein n=1 Tax=Deinococcus aquaedulcis TaxID=2840455 RepID=UPI002E2E5CFA|nr:DUF1294 domain-containing protein [Deinococcus aquaedulcis]
MTLPDVLALAFRLFVVWQLLWGLAAFVAVWQDKRRAQGGRRRTPEAGLHRLEAWGGALGSGLAQLVFRHKTRKATYQRVYRRLLALWLLGWVGMIALQLLGR